MISFYEKITENIPFRPPQLDARRLAENNYTINKKNFSVHAYRTKGQ